MTITADDREKWAVSNVATVVEQRNKSRNRHKPSAATHHDYNHRVLFPGPRLHQGREQDAAQYRSPQPSSYRDAQRRGAMDAHHDHGYPGLSRVSLYYPER